MNTATTWVQKVISDTELHFTSDTTLGGSKIAKATFTDGKVAWSTDDVPHLVIERANKHFGI
jgi:hypothetical protein